VIYNGKKPSKILIEKYEKTEGQHALVTHDRKSRETRTYKLVLANVISSVAPTWSSSDTLAGTRAFIRHDSHKLAQAIMFLLTMDERKKVIREIL
jgi:hypothetical protein